MTYNREETMKVEVENTLVKSVISMLEKRSTPWVGTMTDLNGIVMKTVKKTGVPSSWPRSPSALRVVLNRVVNRIRNQGVSVRFVRSADHERNRLVVFKMQ